MVCEWKHSTALFAVAILLLTAGCGEEKETVAKAPLVKAQYAGSASAAKADIYAGSVKARYETNLSFQVGGQILSRNVREGSRVSAGDILMSIDPKDVVQQAGQGDAQVASAKAQMDLAKANLDRYEQLYREEAIPAATLDQYRTNYDAALAAYRSATAQASRAHNSLEYANLEAPASGVISSVTAEEGQVVAAGQTVLVLSRTEEFEVEINVPENRLPEVGEGQTLKVSFWAIPGETLGTVREVSPMADPVTRTYRVRISLPNPPAGMELGMTASAEALGREEAGNAVTLPISAIYQTGESPQVWVVENNILRLQPVRVDPLNEKEVSVYGLDRDALVVVAGIHKLREGQRVRTEADGI